MNLPTDILQAIVIHAEGAYPEECCGVIFSHSSRPDILVRARRCANAQDRFHAMDPVQFPRTNRNGYFIDPKDLIAIDNECRNHEQQVRLIYHSHPDAGAYFSEEDQQQALISGEPLYPGAGYLVLSVTDGRVGEVKLFEWDEVSGTFVCNRRF